jgi:hypothetical protein
MKACLGSKLSHISDNIMGRVHFSSTSVVLDERGEAGENGTRILTLFRTPGESLMKVLPLLLLASSMPILTFQSGSLHSPGELQPQRFFNI